MITQLQRVHIGNNQLLFATKLIGDNTRQDVKFDIKQRGQSAHIDDIPKQLALARVGVLAGTDVGQRHTDDVNVIAHHAQVHRLARVIEEVTTGLYLADIFRHALRVNADHDIHTAAATQVTLVADPHFKPGRQPLNVRGEDVFRADRQPHAEQGLGKHVVGAGRTGTVDVCEFDNEIVDCLNSIHCSALLPRLGHGVVKLLHIPGCGWAALGAQSTVQADVFILDHGPPGWQRF